MLLKTDDLGIPRFSNRDLIDMIYSGNVDKCHVVLCDPTDDVDKFNSAMEEQGMNPLQKYIPLDVDQKTCLLYTSPSPRDLSTSRMPSSA